MDRQLRILAGSLATAATVLVPALGHAEMPAPVVAASNEFGFALLDRLREASPEDTVLISPYSLSVALTMVAQGAAGTTAEAFARTLALDETDLDAASDLHAALRRMLEAGIGEDVDVQIANALWAREGVTFQPAFLERQQQDFSASIASVDFLDPATVGQVNAWVSQATGGMIDSLVATFPPETMLFLANAVYFKGGWMDAFDPEMTNDQPFTLGGGASQSVAMMHRQAERFSYAEGPGFQSLEMPYGDGEFALTVILPPENPSAPDWGAWLPDSFPRRTGLVAMPRLNLTYQAELSPILTAMGLGEAFSDTADFSHMVEAGVRISSVVHKAALLLDEEGTEAAAATGITVGVTSAEPSSPFRMVVDRPFYMAIRHRDTGLVLFLGYVGDPGPAA